MRNGIIGTFSLLLALFLLAGCGTDPSSTASTGYTEVTTEQAQRIMAENVLTTVIDLRDGTAYKDARIAGSFNIPSDELAERITVEIPDRESVIFVYAATKDAANTSAKALYDMGYKTVYSLGAFDTWSGDTATG